ncbi:MAG TPA: DUF4468 domain-containing protein [Flavipsychrobacter sp.]|nr:DUF4468 domain-containing protein [Flavipsychrobacter sp.]
MRAFALFLLGMSLGQQTLAQHSSVLINDSSGAGYTYQKTINVPGVRQKTLYNRIKPWVMNVMNHSDNYIATSDAANDSIATISFLELGDLPQIQNQFIEYQANIHFSDGEVQFNAKSFIYHGSVILTNNIYDLPFNNLGNISAPIQAAIYTDFDRKFTALINSLQGAAKGYLAIPASAKK